MPEFSYKARNDVGKDVKGTLTANSKREALGLLVERALFPLTVESAKQPRTLFPARTRIKTPIVTATLSQLADLLDSGVPLMRSLEVLAEQATHPHMAVVLEDVRDSVAEGIPLEKAFARHDKVFNELAVSMVRAGAEGAFLEDALQRTAAFLEQQDELKGRVIGAMTYPAILAVAGFTVTTVLVVFFVPKFADLFARLEKDGGLPIATVVLLWLSDTLRAYGIFILIGAAGLIAWARHELKKERTKIWLDRVKIKVPLFGDIFLGFAVSRFCRVLGTLLSNGVPMLKSLEISSGSVGNRVLAAAINKSAENITSGETLSGPLAACGLFPRSVMAMITVAEEANNLEKVLVKVANSLDRQTDRKLDLMVRLVEPGMLLVMGIVVLFVLLALLLPVFEMSNTVG